MGEIGSFGENCQSEKYKQYNADPISDIRSETKKSGSDARFHCIHVCTGCRKNSCPYLPAKDENLQFYPEDLDIWGQKSIFLFWNRDFCQQGISPVQPGLQLFHWDHPKKISVSEL